MGASESSPVFTKQGPVMVAAIDFGTTFSGYAFSFENEPDEIMLNKNWGSELGTSSLKTPTSVLVDKNRSFVSFGYKAEYDYANFCQDGKIEEYELFKNFKMVLYKEKEIRRTSEIESVRGTKYNALEIFGIALRYLKDHLLDAVSRMNRKPDDKLIRWVLTVPAIWSESAKEFMREAAVKAELIPSKTSEQLLLALEPEAASIYCRSLELPKFNEELPPTTQDLKFKPGTKYMIVDIGGGTVDITAHEIQKDGHMVELMSANGGPCGGNMVNQKFEELFCNIFGEKFVTVLKHNHPSQWIQLMLQWENRKKDVTIIDNEGIELEVTLFLKNKYHEVTGQEIKTTIDKLSDSIRDIVYSEGYIEIGPQTVESIFGPVSSNIITYIEKAMEHDELSKLKYIFLVGGFSNSTYLLQQMKRRFSNTCCVLSPVQANAVILKGAVGFGQNPSIITSRISRKTYGIGVVDTFIERKHDKAKRYTNVDGKDMCKDIFQPFALKGEKIPSNTYKTYPFTSPEKCTNVSIYSSDSKYVVHTDEEGVTKIGELSYKMPLWKSMFTKHQDKLMEIRIYFGKTEIVVQLEDKTSGKVVKTSLNLLQD